MLIILLVMLCSCLSFSYLITRKICHTPYEVRSSQNGVMINFDLLFIDLFIVILTMGFCNNFPTGLDLISNESSKILTQDVLMLMKHFCLRLSPSQR